MSSKNTLVRTIKKISDVLEKGHISNDEYQSTKIPFFVKNKDTKFEMDFYKIEKEYDIPEGLNRNIKLIYQILGNGKKEIYLNDWTILSIEEAFAQYKEYCEAGQKNVYNVAYRYLGMGWVEVLSCDLVSHLLFYRNDGGSNGWDREANFKDVIENGSNKYNKFYFSDWFYNIY